MTYNLGNDYKTIYFIGIGGIHMSGMARLLLEAGYTVKGSDQKSSQTTDALGKEGITVYIGHNANNISENRDIDVVVYTAAVPPTNPEFAEAERLGIPLMERPEMLGLIMKNYKYPICVSGTHGKTTTTSMLTEIMKNSGKNPTSIIGGVLPSIGSSLLIGGRDFFIAESCEYYDAFLKFFPFVGIILNIELDHTDYFGTLSRLRESFIRFARRVPEDGALIIYGGMDELGEITDGLPCRVITYGTSESDWRAENDVYDENGFASFDIFYKDIFFGSFSLSVPGEHNILNALASIAACGFMMEAGLLQITTEEMRDGIKPYYGANRRFQYKGLCGGVRVYDDYSHHPTEVFAVIGAAMKMKYNRLWCVFQPHTKKRTSEMLDSFSKCFSGADFVILLDIYSPIGREENDCTVHSIDLYRKLKENGVNVFYFSSFDEAKTFIMKNSVPNDMLITMGAGDVVLLGESMVSELCE